MMNEQAIADNLLFPLWRCISTDFKLKYRSDAWAMFENFLKSAASCSNLKSFLDKFKRLVPVEWQHQFQKKVLSVIDSGEDEFVLLQLRTECAYLVLLTRVLNEERKAEYNEKQARELQIESDIENTEFDAMLEKCGGDYGKLVTQLSKLAKQQSA